MRTELIGNLKKDVSALASSIILVCRQRAATALTATRREFPEHCGPNLPVALRHLQAGNIAPVDLAQAAIGPGMGVYTRYVKVLDAEGKPVSVREALALINATLDEALSAASAACGVRGKSSIIAVLHQQMAHVAQLCALAGALAIEARIRIGRRGMRRVRALLAMEVAFGIAPATRRRFA